MRPKFCSTPTLESGRYANRIGKGAMNKYLLGIASIALTVPAVALAAEWHLVGDNNSFPYNQVPVVGAVLVDSIKKYED